MRPALLLFALFALAFGDILYGTYTPIVGDDFVTKPIHSAVVTTPEGHMVELTMDPSSVPARIAPGSLVSVHGDFLELDGGGQDLPLFDSSMIHLEAPAPQADILADGTGLGTKTVLIMRVFVCNWNEEVPSVRELEKVIFGYHGGVGGRSLTRLVSDCSHRKMTLSAKIVDVNIPCGVFDRQPCGQSIEPEARRILESRNFPLSSYQHIATVYSGKNAGCKYAAASTCTGQSWYTGKSALNPWVFAHELGHNWCLGHASDDYYEYGDRSSPMGNGLGCYNGPHQWQLGWNSVDSLGSHHFPAGRGQTFTLTALTNPSGRTLAIDVGNTNGLYVSFRGNSGYDTHLSSTYTYKTSVHKQLGFGNRRTSANTFLLGNDPLGDGDSTNQFGLVIRQVSHRESGNNSSARVYVCRPNQSGRETNCNDGLDNDCDGKTDSDDDDCPSSPTCKNLRDDCYIYENYCQYLAVEKACCKMCEEQKK